MLTEKIKKVSYEELLEQKIIPVSVKRHVEFFRFKNNLDVFGMSFYDILNYFYGLIYEKPLNNTISIREFLCFKERDDESSMTDRELLIKKVNERREVYLQDTIQSVSEILTKISKIDSVRPGFKFVIKKTFDYELKRKTKFRNLDQLEADLHNLIEKLRTLSDEDFYDQFLNGGINKSSNLRKDLIYNIPADLDFIKTRNVISLNGENLTLECCDYSLSNIENKFNPLIDNDTVFPRLKLKKENGDKIQDLEVIIKDGEYHILNTEIIKSAHSWQKIVMPLFFESEKDRNEYLDEEIKRLTEMKS